LVAELRNIWEVCELEDDIKYGKLELARFAVELYDVIEGKADKVYTDPRLFLSHTYLSSNMRYLLREALKRLSGKGGQPVFVLDTEFGGGKTHTILLLYHVFKNRDVGADFIRDVMREAEVTEIPPCRVLAIDCRKMSKETLWGEIAHGLGRYDLFEEEDRGRKPVRDVGKLKSLLDGPTLILLDELPHHLLQAEAVKVGDTNLCNLTVDFVVTLVSAVSSTKDSMLVISLTGKQKLYEEYRTRLKGRLDELAVEKVDSMVRDALSRQAEYIVPMEKEEVAQALKKRLIKSINEEHKREVVERYYNYLVEKRLVDGHEYRVRLEESYPFHPFLIDILYDRVSTIDAFNKTRGIFRLLSLTLHRLYRDRIECKLLSPGDIPLEDNEIKEELTNRLGRGSFRPVIETDCIEKADRLDRKRSVKIVKRISRTIFLYSLIGAEKVSGALPRDVKLGACYPGIDPDLVDEALEEIEREFWYLKVEGGTYYFQTEPNINKIIYDYMSEVSYDELRNAIRGKLQKLLESTENVRTVVWDRTQLEDDSEKLKLMVVDYRELRQGNEMAVLEDLLERVDGGRIRKYRNTLVFLLPDIEGVRSLEESARKLCAVKRAEKDPRVSQDREKLKQLKERESRYEEELSTDCVNVYSRIAYPRDAKIVIEDLEVLDRRGSLTEKVLEKLGKVGKLLTSLNPGVLADLLEKKQVMRLGEVYELFATDRSQPFILSGRTILEAAETGIIKGYFGYAGKLEMRDGKYVAVIGKAPDRIDWDGYLVKKELVYLEPVTPTEPSQEGGTAAISRQIGAGPTAVVKPLHTMSIRVESLSDALKRIREVRAYSPGRKFDARLSLIIQDEGGRIRITVESSDWRAISTEAEKLLDLIAKAGKYTASGFIEVKSEDEGFVEELRGQGWS